MPTIQSGQVAAGLTTLAFGALMWGWISLASAQTTSPAPFRFEEQSVPVNPRVDELFDTRFRIEGMSRYRISLSKSLGYSLDVAQYRDADNAPRRAIVYVPEDRAETARSVRLARVRERNQGVCTVQRQPTATAFQKLLQPGLLLNGGAQVAGVGDQHSRSIDGVKVPIAVAWSAERRQNMW